MSLFYKNADGHKYSDPIQYVYYESELPSWIYFPYEVDTEFFKPAWDINRPISVISQTLTIQHRALSQSEGHILSHPDSSAIARHTVASSGFAVIDYLNQLGNDLGIDTKIRHFDNPYNITKELPVLEFRLYGFFLVADLYRMFTDEYLDDIDALVRQRRKDKPRIEMGRRLIAKTPRGGREKQYVIMPWVAVIEDRDFRVALSFADCCAVAGSGGGYANLAFIGGVELDSKDNFTSSEKSIMQVMYLQRQNDFDLYSIGDLHNYDSLIGFMDRVYTIYHSLNIPEYYEETRLTFGATVARIFRSVLQKHLGFDRPTDKGKKTVIELCRYGTSDFIKKLSTTSLFNAKVDGGRCRNNRPTDISIKRPLADIDISGCYGNGLKNQSFPLGRPIYFGYDLQSDRNQYLTLRQFLKKYRNDLVPGLWQARVSTQEGYTLKHRQDFLVSWFPPKDISSMPTDTDLQDVEWFNEDNIGLTKILHNEIHLALITEEFIDWLDNTASTRQRKELLDSLYVYTALYYPRRTQCKTIEDLYQRIENHDGKNSVHVSKSGKPKVISIQQECHAWYSVNLGELLITCLLNERKKYNKHNPYEKPFNEVFKLCINTIYGDMVSPFFDIGNACVGNNITARARAMAWYMEKGLNGFQSITDGCAFELNRVIHRGTQNITASELITTYLGSSDANYRIKPIGGVDRIELDEEFNLILYQADSVTTLDNDGACQWLEDEISKHLKKLFPNILVIDKFSLEIKDIYDGASFHGTANYKFFKTGKPQKAKMRSYSQKGFKAYKLVGDRLEVITDDFHPSDDFLAAIAANPEAVPRSLPYIHTKILKTGEYRRNYESRWQYSKAKPGDEVESARLLRECSLTQFTFQTHAQFESWEREANRLRDLTGQTYEQWFLNEDGTLNYKAMVIELDRVIRAGAMTFASTRPKASQRNLSREYVKHPAFEALKRMKHQLNIRYGFIPDEDGNESDWLFENLYYFNLQEHGIEVF